MTQKQRNGHSTHVPGWDTPENPSEARDDHLEQDDRDPIFDPTDVRPQVRKQPREVASSQPTTVKEQIFGMEGELGIQAGKQRDRVFLLSNPGGVREDDKNQTVMDIVASACLCDFTPMGDGRQHDGPMYSDLAHFPPAVWAPSAPYHFGDTQSALLAAREVASGQFTSMFAGFEPDEVPLSRRRIAATFITGNPRPGQAFLQALERSLEIPNIVIAHWLATCTESWMIFAVPVTPWEVRSAGLHFDLRAFAPKSGKNRRKES